MQCAR
jgi:hypothetical protein